LNSKLCAAPFSSQRNVTISRDYSPPWAEKEMMSEFFAAMRERFDELPQFHTLGERSCCN
jgi:hypothetical protein